MHSKALNGLKVNVDGQWIPVNKNPLISLSPGQSVRILPGVVHSFWEEKADVIAGEISSINNDHTDNFFPEEIEKGSLSRFPQIVEDAKPKHLLVSDYKKFFK